MNENNNTEEQQSSLKLAFQVLCFLSMPALALAYFGWTVYCFTPRKNYPQGDLQYGAGISVTAEYDQTQGRGPAPPMTTRAGYPMITGISKGSPADSAGIKIGDGIKSIRKVGDATTTSTKDLSHAQLQDLLRGDYASEVIVEIDGLCGPLKLKRTIFESVKNK